MQITAFFVIMLSCLIFTAINAKGKFSPSRAKRWGMFWLAFIAFFFIPGLFINLYEDQEAFTTILSKYASFVMLGYLILRFFNRHKLKAQHQELREAKIANVAMPSATDTDGMLNTSCQVAAMDEDDLEVVQIIEHMFSQEMLNDDAELVGYADSRIELYICYLDYYPKLGFYNLFNFCTNEVIPRMVYLLPNSDTAWRYLLMIQQLGLGVFLNHLKSNQSFTIRLDDAFRYTGTSSPESITPKTWLQAVNISILTRQQVGIDYLKEINLSEFQCSPDQASCTTFELALIELYQTLLTRGSDIMPALTKINNDDVSSREDEDEEHIYARTIQYPLTKVIQGMFSDEQAFNQAIQQALELHHEYYLSRSPLQQKRELYSLPLTALTILAHDIFGFKLHQQSQYIPHWLAYPSFD